MHSHTHSHEPPQAPIDWNDAYTGEVVDYEPPDPDLLNIVKALQPRTALDVGCGAGGLVVALAERGWEVTGVDVADRAIAAARRVVSSRGLEAGLVVADAADWTPPTSYELITSSFALPEGAERAAVLGMVRDALSPGGVVAIKEFDSAMSRYGHFAGFDLVTVEELLDAFAGFEVERAEVVPTPLHEHARGVAGADEDWTAALLCARKPRGQG